MKFIKKQLSLWRLVLIMAVAAIAIPIASRVGSTARGVAKERHTYLDQQITADNEDADAKNTRDSKAAVSGGVARPQDDYYDRRREYWERRVDRRLEQEDLDDDDEDADAKDSKDNKAAKNKDSKADADDEDDVDDADKEIERRREYWRKRLDRDW